MSSLVDLKDVVESALAVAIFPVVLLVPGYLLLWGRAQAWGHSYLPKRLSESLMNYTAATVAFYCFFAATGSAFLLVLPSPLFEDLPSLPMELTPSSVFMWGVALGCVLVIFPAVLGGLWGRISNTGIWERIFRCVVGGEQLEPPNPAWNDFIEMLRDGGAEDEKEKGKVLRIVTRSGEEHYGFGSERSFFAKDGNVRDMYVEPIYKQREGGEFALQEGCGVYLSGDVVRLVEVAPPSAWVPEEKGSLNG